MVIYLSLWLYTHIYIHTHTERERERMRDRDVYRWMDGQTERQIDKIRF